VSAPVLKWFELRWPREVDSEKLVNVFRMLAGSKATPVVVEAIGIDRGVIHRLALPEAAAPMLLAQMRAALPAIGFVKLESRPPVEVDRAVEMRLSTRSRPLDTKGSETVCRALLTALATVRNGESLVLQWQLVRAVAPLPVGSIAREPESGSLAGDVSRMLLGGSRPLDSEARSALRAKRSLPSWWVVGRIGAHADDLPRQRQLISQVVGALRSAETPGVRFVVRTTNPTNVSEVRKPWRIPTSLNIGELATVAAWPVGDTGSLPVAREGSRVLAPAKAVPSRGRVLGISTFPGRERAVAIGVRDSLRHLHVVGPTGVGKSTIELRLICQDIEAGRAVVVVEPKGDLISDVLARIPSERQGDVVLIDPTDREAVVGINPLASNQHSPELVADQLLGVFHHLYAASWGPRTSDILHASLLTLARTPGMSLANLPQLLGDQNFRRRIVGRRNEPGVLQPVWQGGGAWSDAERVAAIAPVMNKVRPMLIRSSLRAVLGQSIPRFELQEVFSERKILLVNLAKGLLGPEAAALLGSIVVTQLWQVALERSAIPAERRHPVFIFLDEFQDFLNLPIDLADALAQARGLGLGLTLAHQHLGQLSPQMRSAVLANARSRVVFQLAAEDARTFAGADTTLLPEDFRTLGAFEAYAQLVAQDAVQPWLSLRTEPPTPATSDPNEVKTFSRSRYATALAQVDEELRLLQEGGRATDIGPKPRERGAR
jgi:hypothetical protein